MSLPWVGLGVGIFVIALGLVRLTNGGIREILLGGGIAMMAGAMTKEDPAIRLQLSIAGLSMEIVACGLYFSYYIKAMRRKIQT